MDISKHVHVQGLNQVKHVYHFKYLLFYSKIHKNPSSFLKYTYCCIFIELPIII